MKAQTDARGTDQAFSTVSDNAAPSIWGLMSEAYGSTDQRHAHSSAPRSVAIAAPPRPNPGLMARSGKHISNYPLVVVMPWHLRPNVPGKTEVTGMLENLSGETRLFPIMANHYIR